MLVCVSHSTPIRTDKKIDGLSENTQFNWRHIIENGQNPQNIGRPSDTTTSYVLKPGTTELAPILVPGELCLGGHQLARGYLNRPEKTKEVFIDNPFGPGKLYRTGDLVLTCADGSIEMIGRIDFSIKINDQRVDPGESNSIIQLHPQVKDSSVVAASISGRRVLVAVIVPADETNWDRLLPDIRKKLEDHLPLYMIPFYWLTRKDLPLNINGKVDVPVLSKICEDMGRNGLMQRPRESQNQDGEDFSTEEKIVRDLFADALSIHPANIARHDSFLTIGGTSLDAIKVSSAALKLDLQIHTVQILQGGSISELAKASSPQNGHEVESPSEPFSLAPQNFSIDSSEVEDVFPATPLQEGLIADSILMKTDYMFLKLFSLEGLPLSELKNAFQIVMDERSLYRTTFVAHGTSFLQLIRKHVDLPWENLAIDLPTYLHRKREASDFVALHAPLLRVVVLNQDIVVVETHHALVDSWSYHFLFEDVRTVLSGKKLDVRPSFRKYIEHLGTQQKEPSYQFWKEYMKGARPIVLETTEHGAFFSEIEIDFDLKAIESSNPSTAAALLYASWAVILSSWTSSDDVVFIVNVSGREAPLKDILTINGPTLSTAPMRVGIDSRATVRQLAQQLVPEFWKLAEHSHIGLRNILRATGLSSGLANTAANYLISMESSQATQGLEPFFLKYQNATDLITIEVENRNLGRMKMFSNKGLVAADAILADMRDVLRAAVQEPRTTIGELRSRVGPRQQPPQEPAMKMPEFSSSTAVQEHSSSESQSPITNPVFDKQDLPITGLSTPRTESLSENQERPLKSIFEAWKEYLTDSETTILDHSPQEFSTVMKSIPSVVLKSAAAKLGVSQEAILYAAWGIILGRHTNVSNPLFGVICSGINNWVQYSQDSLHFVPQRLALGTDLSLRQIFTAVERDLVNRPEASELNLDQALDFSDHHSIAFDSLVKLQSDGDESTTSQPSLVQFYGRQGFKYTMLDITTAGNQTTFKLSSRISEERGECILDELSNVIQAAVTVPSTVLRSFNMIGERERNMLHELAHFTTLEGDLVHSRFEKFAREKPHTLALQFETSDYVTYKELNERANRLARHLMSIGVGPEQMVPLYLDKSVEMIVAILAVLKAGAAYVPLSPDNPSRRNLFILDEVRARFIITQTWYKDFDSHHGATSVFVDHLPRLDQVSALDTGAGNVDSLAYCIYTSGSTGTPKGVNVSHRAISIAVQGMTTDEGIKSDWKHLLFANYTFDVSVHDIFTILGCGGTLCLASTERMISDLAGVINEMEVTQTFLTPTVARLISPEQVPRVETLLCSGEALTADIIEAWSPHRTLINLYGPTECAVNATVGYIRPDTKPTALGKPICTASIMVVVVGGPDLAPLGAIGEICIAGGHVAEGYVSLRLLPSLVPANQSRNSR
jgi:amino acid adenylation domain-containing protein